MTRFHPLAAVLLGASMLAAVPLATAAASANAWRAVWGASPSHALTSLPLAANQSVRQVVHLSASGRQLRLRLTQRYGTQAVSLGAVSVGLRDAGSANGIGIVPGSLRAVRFGGARGVTIPGGTSVASDAIDLPVAAFQDLVISFATSSAVAQVTEHAIARATPYFSRDAAAVDQLDAAGYRARPLGNQNVFVLLEGVDVIDADASTYRTVVAFGDSVTDGYVSSGGSPLLSDNTRLGFNERYPDFLALRLAQRFPARYTVVNAGISGNRVAAGPFLPTYGPSLVDRLDQDVLAVPGVTDVIVVAGQNDLGFGSAGRAPDPAPVIAGLTTAVSRMKAAGLRVLLGTIPPASGAFAGPLGAIGRPGGFGALHGSQAADDARQLVNAWVRNQSIADAVVDFDACLRDPVATSHLRADYDSGDHLHPNARGYAAMAACVDLDRLQ